MKVLVFMFICSISFFSCASHPKGLKAKHEYIEQLKAQGKRPKTVNDNMESFIGKHVSFLIEDIRTRVQVQRGIKLTDSDIKSGITPIHSGFRALQVENDYHPGRSCKTNVYLNFKDVIVGWDFLPNKGKQCIEPVMNPKAVSTIGKMALSLAPQINSIEKVSNQPKIIYITQMVEGNVSLSTPTPLATPTRNWVKADEMINYVGLTEVEVIDKHGIADRIDKLSNGVKMMVWTSRWSSTYVSGWGFSASTNNYKCHVGVIFKKGVATGWKISGNCSDKTEAGGVISSIIPIPKSKL